MIVEYLVENQTLTALTDFLNKNEQFKKQSGKEFSINDLFTYCRLKHLPYYMGGNKIEESDIKVGGVKLYNIRK